MIWIGVAPGFGQTIGSTVAANIADVTNLTLVQDADGIFSTYAIVRPAMCQLVLYLATAAKPGAADFGGGGDPAYIDLGTVNLTVEDAEINATLPPDLNGTYQLAALPVGGGDADVAESNAAAIDTRPPVYIAVTQIADNITGSYGNSRSFLSLDLSGQVAGTEILVLFHGEDATSATLGGTGMTHLTSGATYGAGLPCAHAFAFTLAADGTAGTSLHVFHANSGLGRNATAYAIVNGTIDEVAANNAAASAGTSLAVTPTTANNVVLGLNTVVSGTITTNWTGVTETLEAVRSGRLTSFARADGVPVAELTATTAHSADADASTLLVSISEVAP